jgi:hypothetical protein
MNPIIGYDIWEHTDHERQIGSIIIYESKTPTRDDRRNSNWRTGLDSILARQGIARLRLRSTLTGQNFYSHRGAREIGR